MKAECVHRWLIETPNGGPTSPGQCRNCGAVRDFLNSDPADSYNGIRDYTVATARRGTAHTMRPA